MSDLDSVVLRELKEFLYAEIPLTQTMGVRVALLQPLTLEAPVALNSNHLRTAFGGSINAVATLAAYALLWLELHECKSMHVVIAESSIRFLRPVRETIRAVCPPPDGLEEFKRGIALENRALICLSVTVEENGAVAAEFHGSFVARRAVRTRQ